jgi:hypothetical protein
MKTSRTSLASLNGKMAKERKHKKKQHRKIRREIKVGSKPFTRHHLSAPPLLVGECERMNCDLERGPSVNRPQQRLQTHQESTFLEESAKRLYRSKCLDFRPGVTLARHYYNAYGRKDDEVESARNAEYERMRARYSPVICINREIQIHNLSL